MKRLALAGLALLVLSPLPVHAEEAPTPQLGKQLFESTHLGSNGKSCATCHPDGKGLSNIGRYDDRQLKGVINGCIGKALAGTPFAMDSQELEAMLAYLRTLQNP